MRVVALDLGTRRIGVAVSDSGGLVATPHAVLQRSASTDADLAAVGAVVRELGAGLVVVGLPLSLDGSHGPAAIKAQEEAQAIGAAVGVPVELHDERLTTVAASRGPSLRAGRSHRTGRTRRRIVDDSAAALILQSWLDIHGGT